MTLPNRPNYTPGEKKRVRKCATAPATTATAAAAAAPHPSVAARTRASGKQRATTRAPAMESKRTAASATHRNPLQAEMVAELAVFSPLVDLPSTPSGTAAAAHPTQPHAPHASLAPLLASKQQLQQRVELARQRLLNDELFQQQNARGNRLLAVASAAAANEATDPLHAAVQSLPAFDLPADGDDSMESVLADLQSIGAACVQELAPSMAMLDNAQVGDAYRDAIGALQAWHARQLHQSWQSLLLERASPLTVSTVSSPMSTASESPSASAATSLLMMTGSERRPPAKKRANLSKTAKSVLKTWFDNHLHHPYPTEEEKDALGRRGGITLEQVNNWFINTRGRKWKPMLSRLMAEKEAGECELFDQMVQRIEEPYRRAPTKR